MNNEYKYLFSVLSMLLLTSCHAEIESSAANSASAIAAVIGEYVYAIIALLLCGIWRLIRIAGGIVITYFLYVICFDSDSTVSNPCLLLFGLALLTITSIIPVKTYQPKIVIAKHVKRLGNRIASDNKWKLIGYDLVIGIVTGAVLLIMENVIFVQK